MILFSPARRLWSRLTLSAQFMTVSIGLIVGLLSIAGVLQSWWLTRGLMQANTQVASVYMDAVIAPHLRATTDHRLDEDQRRAIETDVDALMARSGIRAVTLWTTDGVVVFSTWKSLVGQSFESDDVEAAAEGRIVQHFAEPDEHVGVFAEGDTDIVEIYIPIRDPAGRVVAVGEFYQSLSVFRHALAETIAGGWGIRIVFSLIVIVALFLLVRSTSTRMRRQRSAIRNLAKNTLRYRREIEALRGRADRSRNHAAQASEMLLSRIGGEIHDGPVQLLTIAMLQLGPSPQRQPDGATPHSRIPGPADLLTAAIGELRSMSAGLILPELEDLTLDETLRLAIARHERLTGTTVEADIASMPATSLEMRACIYRIVQEALNNAVRHAGGRGQSVRAEVREDQLVCTVSDEGPGISDTIEVETRPRLGLLSSRHRAQTFGGKVVLDSRMGSGTRMIVTFPLEVTSSLKPERRASKHLQHD